MLSVGRILEGAFGLVRERFTAVAVWIGIYIVAYVAMMLSMGGLFTAAMDPALASDPAAMMATVAPIYLLGLLVGLIGLVLYAAAMRAVLRPNAGGIAYLRLGMDELRLLGLLILFTVVGTVLMIGLSILLAFVGIGLSASTDSAGLGLLINFVMTIAIFAVFVFLIVRFSLAFPLTLHRRRIVIGEAWALSRGRFWSLFGAALVITLLMLVLSILVSTLSMGGYILDLMAAAGDPAATMEAAESQTQALASFGPTMILYMVGSAIIAGIWVALAGGSIATAAKLLVADEMDDAEDVFG